MRISPPKPLPKCRTCGATANWFYTGDLDKGYCEDCVPRECSCVWDEDLDDYARDGLGRPLPCVDYIFCEERDDNEESI